MAEVVTRDQHSGLAGTASTGPVFEMVSNSDFTFPPRPQPRKPRHAAKPMDTKARPASACMHIDIPRSDTAEGHRRTVSTLPSFAFNATDTSGLHEDDPQPRTPDESVAVTPSRRGHRRGGSEFVGGDSRLGVSVAVSSSPTKASALSEIAAPATAPPTTGRRGHAHRRSAAISSHDVAKLMQPPVDVQPRLSSSLPNTPLERTADDLATPTSTDSPVHDSEVADPFGPPLDTVADKPPSRPRVGFSDNVEFIPRPLSTISSDTESSMSTVRGHSVNNSISSMLSLSTPSPPSSRTPVMLFGTTRERVSNPPVKSSLEVSKRVEKEGQWLRRRSSESLKRPLSESAEPRTAIKFAEQRPDGHRRMLSLSQALFDRRRSEPSISINTADLSRLSAISLQESTSSECTSPDAQNVHAHESKSSARKIKDWATAKISKKAKEAKEALMSNSTSSIRPESAGSLTVPGKVPLPEPPVAETDLDAVFSSQVDATDSPRPPTPGHSRVEMMAPSRHSYSAPSFGGADDADAVLDLDAALGPFKTPPIGSHRQRKELHSSRLTKDFNGPGGHYHRRSESAPNLPPFEDAKLGPPIMADVCEEEEEQDAVDVAPSFESESISSRQECESGVGIQIVDVHTTTNAVSMDSESDDGLDILQTWESEHSTASLGSTRAIFSHTVPDSRGSIIEHTIMEETGSLKDVEIVEDDEEPRISSQTKSSDSSDTPTIIPTQIATLTLPDGQQSLMTPETYQTSTFSSPSLRPGSFDTDTHRLDTSASSITDNRTLSSCTTGDHLHELRVSVDVPSLTSSRSTMISSVPGNHSNRDFGNTDRSSSLHSQLTPSRDPSERRRKRGSIQSLSQLVGSPFGPKSKGFNDARPDTSNGSDTAPVPKRKDHRLKKLMFWKSKEPSNRLSLPAS